MWVCRLPVHIGPLRSYEFAEDYRENGAFCRADVGIGPYKCCTHCVGNFEQFQASREKSRKTEAVFLAASRGLRGGKLRSPPARFLFVTFSFGEAKK